LPRSSRSSPLWHRPRCIITITRVITIIPITTTTWRRIQPAKAGPDPDRIAALAWLKMP